MTSILLVLTFNFRENAIQIHKTYFLCRESIKSSNFIVCVKEDDFKKIVEHEGFSVLRVEAFKEILRFIFGLLLAVFLKLLL